MPAPDCFVANPPPWHSVDGWCSGVHNGLLLLTGGSLAETVGLEVVLGLGALWCAGHVVDWAAWRITRRPREWAARVLGYAPAPVVSPGPPAASGEWPKSFELNGHLLRAQYKRDGDVDGYLIGPPVAAPAALAPPQDSAKLRN